ncbi:zinc finger, CCHC-type containing protein [Tanacetum coccineum]
MNKRNKIAIAIIVAFIVCIVPTLASVFSRKHGAKPSHVTPKVASKVADFACNLTDYKEVCKDTMTPLTDKASVRDVFKTAIRATKVAVDVAGTSMSLVASKDGDVNSSSRLDGCKELMEYASDELRESSRIVEDQIKADLGILDKQLELMNLLSAVVAYQETCLDGFDKPELRDMVEKLLLNSTQLISNALSIVASTPKILEEFNITAAKPKFLGRKLLGMVAKDGSGKFDTIMSALAAYPKDNVGRYVVYVKEGIYEEYVVVAKHQQGRLGHVQEWNLFNMVLKILLKGSKYYKYSPSSQCPNAKKLKPSNYSLWAIRMQIILEANGLWEMIEPNEKTQADNKKDKTAIAFLYQSLPEEQLLQITKHKTAKAIWNALKTRHIGEERVQQARLQTLKSDFEMLHMKEDETIDAFTTKLTTLVNKAASLGHTMEDETLVRKLLNAVPDRYLQIVASIEQYSDLSEMTLEEAIGRLKTYEERIKHKSKQVDNQDRLLFTRYQEQGRMRGHGGFNQSRGQENNFKKETHNNSNKLTHDKSKVMCFKCKEYGHFANRCPLKKEEQSNLTEEDLEPQLLMAIIEESQIWNGRKFHSTST